MVLEITRIISLFYSGFAVVLTRPHVMSPCTFLRRPVYLTSRYLASPTPDSSLGEICVQESRLVHPGTSGINPLASPLIRAAGGMEVGKCPARMADDSEHFLN
jgi:hypothetical protein